MTIPSQFHVIMTDDGKIELRDNREMPITDPSVVRKIKASDSYKSMVQNLEAQRMQKLDQIYNDAKAENDKFIQIYKQSPRVDSIDHYIQILNSLRPQLYTFKT